MVEQEGIEKKQTVEELKQELLEYLKDADFGTPKYQALGDFLNLEEVEESLEERQASLLSEKNKRRIPYMKSKMRVEEIQVALLKHKIASNRSVMKGYGPAYDQFAINTDEISEKLSTEGNNDQSEEHYKLVRHTTLEILWGEYFRRAGE